MTSNIVVDSKSQWYGVTSKMQEADIILLHTTEGSGWPGYNNGAIAPHATIKPIPGKGISVRWHIPWDCYAKALKNEAGGVETNRRGVLQVELVGTCDPRKPTMYQWAKADDAVLKALADYIRPLMKEYNIPPSAPIFKAYPGSYGTDNGVRFSGATWNKFNGVCGHQHAPENVHGDPGSFPIQRFLKFVGPTT